VPGHRPDKIRILQEGGVPIHEPGSNRSLNGTSAVGRLNFTTDVPRAVAHGTIQLIAVGTPPGQDGSADLSNVVAAARNIGRFMNDHKVVVDKSTVPVGTADRVRAAIAGRVGHPWHIGELRRGFESGVSQGRCGRRRLHEARSRHRRDRR
jgi:UDPglucose 6-dehydrogenase